MTLRTLWLYLIGNRSAIREIANDRGAFKIGALFVFSAALARGYDGEDLLREPWHLVIPLAASTAAAVGLSLLIYGLIRGVKFKAQRDGSRVLSAIVRLFWMTAPLAWLYAIPYERFMSPVDAVVANLLTLALVATWRVLLITRAIAVLLNVKSISVFCFVMLFSDALVLVAVAALPDPLIEVMGGLHLSEADSMVRSVSFAMAAVALYTLPVWFVGALVSARFIEPTWPTDATLSAEVERGPLRFAYASVLIWIPVLFWIQPEQRLRSNAERLFEAGDVARMIEGLSAHRREEYPPHWDPPPRAGWNLLDPSEIEVISRTVVEGKASSWVTQAYAKKVERELIQEFSALGSNWVTIASVIVTGSGGRIPRRASANSMRFVAEHLSSLTAEERHALLRVIAWCNANAVTDH